MRSSVIFFALLTACGCGAGITSVSQGTMTISNTTVSGNAAAASGGALRLGLGPVTMANCTVSDNTAGEVGAALHHGGNLTVRNSLIDGDCVGVSPSDEITSEGGNVESISDTCGFDQPADQVNVSADDLKLGPLADNGGPTMTHALGAGSVAIDQIPAVDCVDAGGAALTTDQRGEPRDSVCDVGAFEVQP